MYVALGLTSIVAGFQNALAGGGSFLILPALLLTGLDARAANVTSTIALFPAQLATGFAGRRQLSASEPLPLAVLSTISLIGGGVGALVLLSTPSDVFSRLLPWLVLFTTMVFAWGNVLRRPDGALPRLTPMVAGVMQAVIAVYGGYFGGGIGILMLAVFTLSGFALRSAAATKNVLVAVINSSAVLIFAFSKDVGWTQAAIVCTGAVAGGQLGAYALQRVNEQLMRWCIVGLGLCLTVGLFARGLT